MSALPHRISYELLPFVLQPAQYIGGEINQLVADGDWQRAEVRVAVAFPDAYKVGMSHLGCQILYWLINHTLDCCAERVYCPRGDAEAVMRKKGIELFTWDTRQPVSSADILAVSLQYEMTVTGFLQLLDLAGIPLRSCDRDDRHPLVIVGGPQVDNPEPVASFIDLAVLGDGEVSMAAILDAYRELKMNGVRRRDMIPTMAQLFEWIYAPECYSVQHNDDRTIRCISPKDAAIPTEIRRCHTPDFENAAFPVRPLVPHVGVVHDRMAIEIMRGCPQQCRFCHAGFTKRPVRLRSVDKILEIAEQMYWATGMDELGLLSLSTADYPHLGELARRANERFAPRRVNISLPSLRIDKMLQDIPGMVSAVRKSGLTMAVEAAADDMRAAIRKRVTDGDLLEGVKEAYKAGWRSVKLYFMCGFPGEREEDIDGIIDLSREVSDARRAFGKGPAQVGVSVGWLVPKPHTPLQWAKQPEAEYFHEARRRLHARLREGGRKQGPIKIKTHRVERSILEAVIARGDRRLADVIEQAYRFGARFDAWDECFNPDNWTAALDATGIDPAWYAHRERSAEEVFPWSHLRAGKSNDYLRRQYEDLLDQRAATHPGSTNLRPEPRAFNPRGPTQTGLGREANGYFQLRIV